MTLCRSKVTAATSSAEKLQALTQFASGMDTGLTHLV